jgi:hypothetical protein
MSPLTQQYLHDLNFASDGCIDLRTQTHTAEQQHSSSRSASSLRHETYG